MGNDGGSIPSRRELVKEAHRNPTATELKESQKEHLAHRWSICPISNTALRRPVVSDSAGLLYNKDAVLQYLLPAESTPLNKDDCDNLLQGRIKGLKDVAEVHFETNSDLSSDNERWICPVTSKELGAAVKAVYVIPCGHAFSQESIKEMRVEQCPQCNQPYEAENVIPIFPSSVEDKEFLRKRIDALTERGLTHTLKKRNVSSKKRKANRLAPKEGEEAVVANSIPTIVKAAPVTHSPQHPTPNSGSDTTTHRSSTTQPATATATIGIKHTATANLTAKVMEEEKIRQKRRILMQKGDQNQHLESLFTKTGKEGGRGDRVGSDADSSAQKKMRDGDFMTRGFSIRG